MFSLRILVFFIGWTLAVPLTSETINLLEKRAPPCNVRYGWTLSHKDCMEAASKLLMKRISVWGRILPESGTYENVTPLGPNAPPGLDRPQVPPPIIAKGAKCVIGVSPTPGSVIEPSDWDSIMGKTYNMILNCVMPFGQGGKDTAGASGNTNLMIWQEDHLE